MVAKTVTHQFWTKDQDYDKTFPEGLVNLPTIIFFDTFANLNHIAEMKSPQGKGIVIINEYHNNLGLSFAKLSSVASSSSIDSG